MSVVDHLWDPHTSLRDELTQRLLLVSSAYRSQVLLQDRERQSTGEQFLNFFEIVKEELEHLTPHGGKVAICCRDTFLQVHLILAAFYAQRVPVVFTAGKHEDVLAAQNTLGIAAILEESDLRWHARPQAPALVFSPDGEFLGALRGRLMTRTEPALSGCGLILFTSGTMGNQKAVNLPLRGMIDTYKFLGRYFTLSSKDVAAILLPISHTFGLNTQLMPAFFAGSKSVLLNQPSQLGRQYDGIGKAGGTFVASVNDLLRLLIRERDVRKLPPCEEVRHVQLAAGKITDDHIREMRDLFPNAVLHKGYGMTETIRTSMVSSDDPHFFSESCGRPLPGQEVRVLNEDGQPVELNEPGEIYVRSNTTLLAYDNRPAHSSLDRDGFFATGDYGFMDENGHLICVDRLDRVFKIAGKKVSALELENVAITFDQVEGAKCAPVSDSKKGLRPVLFIEIGSVSDGNPELCLKEFEIRMRENLDPSKVPRDVVITDRLPRTSNSKVKIDALQRLWETKDQLVAMASGSNFIRFHRLVEAAE